MEGEDGFWVVLDAGGVPVYWRGSRFGPDLGGYTAVVDHLGDGTLRLIDYFRPSMFLLIRRDRANAN